MTNADRLNNDLPEAWVSARVTEICELVRGVSYASGEECNTPKQGYVPLLRASNINGAITFHDLRHVPARRVASEQMLRLGDVVVAMSSGSKTVVGKAARVDHNWNGTFGAFCGVLRPSTHLDSRYFGLFFQTKEYRDFVSEASAGVNINNLKRDHFAQINVPIPPLTEQTRIACHVEGLLLRIDSARNHLSRVPAILKRFRQAVLAVACSGRLTQDWREEHVGSETGRELLTRIRKDRRNSWSDQNRTKKSGYPEPQSLDVDQLPEIPESWTWTTLDQVIQEGRPIIYGIIKPGPHTADGIPYVRVMEMEDGKLVDPKQLRCAARERAAKFCRATLAAGDVLISKDGTIGRVSVVPPELAGGNITQHLVRAAIHRFVNLWFAVAAIRSPHSQQWLVGELKGVALRGVNVRDFRRLPIPLPPVDEQHEIIRRLECLSALAETTEQRVKAASGRAAKLTQFILAKAFRGELVPTEAELARREGRDYEPASVLLERITHEKAKGGGTGTRSKRHS
jgi:type I restriction enzyme, S subunit